jgi:CheY-like chemotaxis protein
MRSVPGHGTVFTLELPVGKPAPAPLESVPTKAPLGLTLTGKLIVIVEDEPAVRSGLEVLLKGWGAEVASFDGVAAVARWARQCDARVTQPRLLIVDYRLEDGRTGVEAIQVLREVFGQSVPALVVTGSTMTAHDAEAERHDFHLLIKPVVPSRLRAMIGFKLR